MFRCRSNRALWNLPPLRESCGPMPCPASAMCREDNLHELYRKVAMTFEVSTQLARFQAQRGERGGGVLGLPEGQRSRPLPAFCSLCGSVSWPCAAVSRPPGAWERWRQPITLCPYPGVCFAQTKRSRPVCGKLCP
jgi:hypothetical protein